MLGGITLSGNSGRARLDSEAGSPRFEGGPAGGPGRRAGFGADGRELAHPLLITAYPNYGVARHVDGPRSGGWSGGVRGGRAEDDSITVAAEPNRTDHPPTGHGTRTRTRIMSEPRFRGNRWPTLGVEIELQLVDARSMALKSAIGEILADLPEDLHDSVKPEFMQCYVEINTGVCRAVDEVEADLAPKVRAVERLADRHGLRLVWAATHPFSRWRDQEITPNNRYYKLAALLQETVVRPVTFGLHVHVGVESGDKAILIGQRIQRYLPILLAMSANSPFWHGRATGHHAHRIEVLEGFPTGGVMPPLGWWAEFEDLLARMTAAGFVESHREFWWDVRPSAENGTIEVRICDMPADLPDLLGLTAMIQCLVQSLSEEIDDGSTGPEPHPLMV